MCPVTPHSVVSVSVIVILASTGATIDFGPQFYGETSYGGEYTVKKCLVPSLKTLDEYTFKGMEAGHRVYRVSVYRGQSNVQYSKVCKVK